MADDVTDKAPDPNDPNNPNSLLNPNNPNSPLYAANNPQVVQSQPQTALKDNGTDVNVALGMPTSVLPVEQKTMADIQLQEQQDELYAAIKRGDRVRTEELVDRGADVNRPDGSGTTAMMNAVENNDSNMSREFLQQKANGNIAYDPNADQNLTGGVPTTPFTGDPSQPVDANGTPNPNAPGSDNASAANVASAIATGITAEEAAAAGNYALAAQLENQEEIAQEALEANDKGSVDYSDGDMSYASSVADSSYGDWYSDDYGDDYDPYDMYGYDDYDPYGYDDYDPYGYQQDYYSADAYDPYSDYGYDDYGSDPTLASTDPSGGTTGSTLAFSDPSLSDPFSFTDPSLSGTSGSTFNFTDPTLSGTGTGTTSPTSSSFTSSFLNTATDLATLDLMGTALTGGGLISPTNSTTSSFMDFSSPITGGGQTVWNTNFFDPSSFNIAAPATSPTLSVAPTNPYYKPSTSSGMSMGA